jgi:hypothetical protein
MAGLWFDPGFDRSRPSGPESALLPLDERLVGAFDPSRVDPSPGRRLRVVAALVHCVEPSTGAVALRDTHHPFLVPGEPITYGKLLERLQGDPELEDVRVTLARLPLRLGQPRPLVQAVPADYQWTARDPDLPPALQDLGDEINEDIREALETLDDASAYYAGVDEGIEPVPDEHVKLVIWALQRELNRELRPAEGQYGGSRRCRRRRWRTSPGTCSGRSPNADGCATPSGASAASTGNGGNGASGTCHWTRTTCRAAQRGWRRAPGLPELTAPRRPRG